MFKFLINSIYYAPVDAPTIAATDNKVGGNGKQETIDLVDDLDFSKSEPETIDIKTDKSKKDDKEDEVDLDTKKDNNKEDDEDEESEDSELEDLLEETKEPTEEQLELSAPTSRRAILKKYPEVFKDFPSLEKSYYRDQKFTEHFATPKEAEEAIGKIQVLDDFEKDIMAGNTEAIFKSVKEGDTNAFYKVVDNLLPTLEKIDREAYLHVMGNNAKEIIRLMWNTAKESNDEDLQNAARSMNKFLFGNEKYTPPTKLSRTEEKVDNSKEQELSKREQEFNERQLTTAKNGLMGKIDNSIKATITKKIDEKDQMPEYVKKNAIRDALETFETQIKGDKSFQSILTRLWDYAKSKDYSQESLDKIKTAYTSKAGALLASVIKKARNEALKGIGKRVKEDREEPDDSADDNKSPRREKPRTPSNAGRDDKNMKRPGETTAEWLARV